MKKNKIVNKIGILVLAVMLSILSSITVLASEPEAVKSRTSKGRAEQAERRRAEQEAHQRAEAERRATEEQQRIASRRYIGRGWEFER